MSEDENGILSVPEISFFAKTAEYHKRIGSTLDPDDPLVLNPGKTNAELMTDDQILVKLRKGDENIFFFQEMTQKDPIAAANAPGNFLRHLKEIKRLNIIYLKEIGRLPPEYDTDESPKE